MRRALQARRRASASKAQPICVYDLAERLGANVMFCPESTLGGIYSKTSNTILIPARRPRGRQAFTCAHELGHSLFEHGTRVDELREIEAGSENIPEEHLANAFATALLMPPWAIRESFSVRDWDPATCSPIQVYTVALQLGVGYETLVQHLRYGLGAISHLAAERLLKTSPKEIRARLLGSDDYRYLVIADRTWFGVAIDLQVGDAAILPADAKVEGSCAAVIGGHKLGLLVEALAPGIGRAETGDGPWASYVRVSRKEYVGWNAYRHWEDPDVD